VADIAFVRRRGARIDMDNSYLDVVNI